MTVYPYCVPHGNQHNAIKHWIMHVFGYFSHELFEIVVKLRFYQKRFFFFYCFNLVNCDDSSFTGTNWQSQYIKTFVMIEIIYFWKLDVNVFIISPIV